MQKGEKSKMILQQYDPLESPTLNLPQWNENKEERDVRFQDRNQYNEKIHVLIETQSLDKGGLEQVVFNLATGLKKGFFEVIIVTQKGGAIAHRCKENGIPVEILQHDKEREYQEILDQYQIDIVISHYSTFGARLAFEKGIPTLSVIHNIYSWFPDDILSSFKSADPFVSKYIAVSEEVKSYAHYRFNIPLNKIVVIPNGMDPKEYLSRPPSKILHRSDLGLQEEDYIFINVASIGPPKAQNVILAALDILIEAYPQIKVLSVGGVLDESYAHFLKERIEELHLSSHFKIIGQVEDVRPYLLMADAFLLTSLIEGWPLSVMEAMVHRLPVITTKVGGVSSIVGNEGAGVLLNNCYEDFRLLDVPVLDQLSREISPRNAEEVARAMKRFYEERESWKKSGRKGYERIVKHFDLQTMVYSYEKELFSLYFTFEKLRRHQNRNKIREQEGLIRANEETIKDLRDHIVFVQEQVTSKISFLTSKMSLLDSKIDDKSWRIEGQLNYIMLRLSLRERMKGVAYRLMKNIHRLVPLEIREKHRNRYRKIFLDKITPADSMSSLDDSFSSQGDRFSRMGESAGGLQWTERNPIQDFLLFKRELKRGLPIELTDFRTNYIPGLVSVVLPVYNQAYLLGESIESVLQQTYTNLNLIVVNDGSTDEIEKVLEPYRSHVKIKIINQDNQKLPAALSNGFRFARGEYFTWTSADNLMDKRQLESQVEFLIKHPGVQMVYSNYDIMNDDGKPLLNSDYCPGYQKPFGSNHIHLPRDVSELNVIRNNYIGPCFMYRHWVGKLIGDYDASMFTMEDYDYWMTINAFFKIEHLGKEEPLYCNRVHQDSLTGRMKELNIVEKTDRLMEFERMRREFYRKKLNVYLIGNDDRLNEIKGCLETNGNVVRQFHIPTPETQMQNQKAIGIWIYSDIEKGFITRVIRENPHAFFVLIHLNPGLPMEGEFLNNFGMYVAISKEIPEDSRPELWFYGNMIHSTLYPILCKANIELFRRQVCFDQWNYDGTA
jgi:glycosyltransferase involved in cell wall biosynthesis